jgi:hypothetical protein
MILKTIKDLDKLIKLCKKQGISGIKVGNVEFNLEPIKTSSIEPISPEASVKVPKFNGSLEPDKIDTDQLTEEQLMYYSVKGEPGADS